MSTAPDTCPHCGAPDNSDCQDSSRAQSRNCLMRQVKGLQRWKSEAMTLFENLDFQVVGQEIGTKTGHDIASEILPWIRDAKKEIASLRQQLADDSRPTAEEYDRVCTSNHMLEKELPRLSFALEQAKKQLADSVAREARCITALNLVHPCPYCGLQRIHDVGCKIGEALSAQPSGALEAVREAQGALEKEIARHWGVNNPPEYILDALRALNYAFGVQPETDSTGE